MRSTSSAPERFSAAVDSLIEQVKDDRSVLAAILCGSLSHDTVWDKSDVDLVFITIDERKVSNNESISLNADGVNVHASLMPRAEFRKIAEGGYRNSFFHSFLAKGRLLYTHDDTIADLCATLREIGERDTKLALLRAGTNVLGPLYKAHKWLVTRGDLEYTALWILYAPTPLAQIEVLSAHQIVDREVIPQAARLNPAFFQQIYTDLLNTRKTRERVQAALAAIDSYLAERARSLFAAIIEHLREVGEVRSCTELENHFTRTYGINGVTMACEYLADQGIIGKAAVSVQLTKRSTVGVQELAFMHLDGADE